MRGTPTTMVYEPLLPARRSVTRIGVGLAVAGLVLVATQVVLELVFHQLFPAPAIACCGVPLAILMALGGAWLALYQGHAEQVVLDTERVAWRDVELLLPRIARVSTLRRTEPGRPPEWLVVLEDDGGCRLELVAFEGAARGRHDLRALLAALLPRLRPEAVVEPRVRDYVAGGRLA